MKRLLLSVAVFVMTVQFLVQPVAAQNVQNFDIASFEADYYLSLDDKNVSHLKVVEKIVAIFPDYNQNHGIERAIPKKYKENDLNLKIESVQDDQGTHWDYTTYDANNNLVVRIGDANKYVRGRQVYTITYTMRDVLSFYDGHDEWYWDVNGTDWRQLFGTITARIHLDPDIAAAVEKQPICFTGFQNQSGQDCIIHTEKEGSQTVTTISSTRSFQPGENISIVIGFKKGVFEKYKKDPLTTALEIFAKLSILLLPVIIAFSVMYRRWLQSGRDPKGRGVIVPQYDIPKDLTPMLAEVVLNERTSTKSISATILELCIAGYLKLYETKKDKLIGSKTDYEIEVVKDYTGLNPELRKVVDMLMGGVATVGTRVSLSELKYKLHSEVQGIQDATYQAVVEKGYFAQNPERARRYPLGVGAILILVGVGISFLFLPFSLGFILAGFIVIVFSNVMPKRTIEGVHMKEYLLGLRDYMKLAEADRIKYLQSPETAEKISVDASDPKQMIHLYEKLLPYAMLFGIEKEWAKQFANLYNEDQSPDWYKGQGVFTGAALGSALGGFSAATAAGFSAPSSSSSSGFSGGFSGGGGGGGGGGGW